MLFHNAVAAKNKQAELEAKEAQVWSAFCAGMSNGSQFF